MSKILCNLLFHPSIMWQWQSRSFHSLATQYAQHQIMVLSIDTFSPLFENVPDNVIFRGADFRGEHAGLMGLGWLYNDLKEEKFDAVAAFQPTFRSRFLCWRFVWQA